MEDKCGIVRTKAELEGAIAAFTGLRARAAKTKVVGTRRYNPGWHLALDLSNMLDAAESVVRSALLREESRGAHTRIDFPETDKGKWSTVNVATHRKGDAMVVETIPLVPPPDDLKAYVHGDQA